MSHPSTQEAARLVAAADDFAAHLLKYLEKHPADVEKSIREVFSLWCDSKPTSFTILMVEAERRSKQCDFTRSIRMWGESTTSYRGLDRVVTTRILPFDQIGMDYTWTQVAEWALATSARYNEVVAAISHLERRVGA